MSSKRIVIVTGGSQNIGLSIAQRFQQTGATVICADLSAPQDNALNFIATDVSSEASVIAMMDQLEKDFGHLDVLVNNAGICVETPIQDTTEQQWDRVMDINIKGTFLTTKHALRLMQKPAATAPTIVNISSIEGIGANPLHAVYAASKAAVAGFTHNTALEYGPYGIRCNAVAPGWINTPFNEQLLAQYPDRKAVNAEIESLHPVGRLGIPKDVANTVFWLASSDSSFITGQEIICDGGRLAKLPMPKL
jgi:meso-butanediol dehydrogenase/(S,S)-butanediol dehydrogenase/diacetyl reductase|tara:strand:- start:868 stop:1617 length:750 start_codon:yes stop_codon:yes gene_type:complete